MFYVTSASLIFYFFTSFIGTSEAKGIAGVRSDSSDASSGGRLRSASRFTGARFSGFRAGIARYNGLVTAEAAGISVRGIDRYVERFNNTEYLEEDPPICYSEDRIWDNESGKTPIMEEIGYFICPYEYTDTVEDRFCCGNPRHQHCCKFWEDWGRFAGTVAAISVAGIALIIILYCIIARCAQSLKR